MKHTQDIVTPAHVKLHPWVWAIATSSILLEICPLCNLIPSLSLPLVQGLTSLYPLCCSIPT